MSEGYTTNTPAYVTIPEALHSMAKQFNEALEILGNRIERISDKVDRLPARDEFFDIEQSLRRLESDSEKGFYQMHSDIKSIRSKTITHAEVMLDELDNITPESWLKKCGASQRAINCVFNDPHLHDGRRHSVVTYVERWSWEFTEEFFERKRNVGKKTAKELLKIFLPIQRLVKDLRNAESLEGTAQVMLNHYPLAKEVFCSETFEDLYEAKCVCIGYYMRRQKR